MKVPLLDLREQYESIRSQIEPAVREQMKTQQFVLGQTVARFESRLAQYSGVEHAIGVSSGTDALLCSLMALGIGHGDEVIVPTFTFFGSAGAIARTGARPVFVDIEADTFNLDVDRAAAAITPRTKAIMPVDLFGQLADMERIEPVASEHGLALVEDACQSIGARRQGKGPGLWGACACLSFYPSKNLAGFGDGGMILCRDAQFAQTCRYLRMHGETQRYHHALIGGNFRLDALQALVLDIKLDHLDGWVEKRRAHAAIYDRLLADVDQIQTPAIRPGNECVYNQYVLRAAKRDDLQRFLTERQVGTAIYYPVPLHLQECFASLNYQPGDCPIAEQACREVLALPVYPELPNESIEYVAQCIREFYKGK